MEIAPPNEPLVSEDRSAGPEGLSDEAEATPAAEARASDAPENETGPEEDAAGGSSALGPGEELSDEALVTQCATLLFASPEPLSLARLVDLLERPERGRVRDALQGLQERLDASELPYEVKEVAGGYRLHTRSVQAPVVARLIKEKKPERISSAALETLAIVAYRQPVTKAEIEAIRGVQAGPVLRSLVDRGLCKIAGRADQPGAPLQYGTTKEFLERFGLARVKELPRDNELAGS